MNAKKANRRTGQRVRRARTRIRLHGNRSFALLEILVSMVILAVAMASVLRCYTNALKSVSYDRRVTQAILTAQSLLEDFEVEPPEDDSAQGTLAPDLPEFSYEAEFEEVEIKYRDVTASMYKKQLDGLRKVKLRVYHSPPSARSRVCILEVETYLTGVEKYATSTKNLHGLF